MNDIRSSLYIVGNLLVFFSFYMTIPGFLDFMEGGNDWVVFATVASLCFFVGLNVSFVFKNKNRDIGILQAFILTFLCWIILTFVGSIPFFLGSPNLSFVDSFFESMSGITTTGATIITDLDSTPKSMLIWRAMLQWLGGIGIIVIAITIIPIPPNHCNIALHINIDFGVESKSVIIVAPVVVIPDIDSKNESTNERFGEPKKNGMDPTKVKIIQLDNFNFCWIHSIFLGFSKSFICRFIF